MPQLPDFVAELGGDFAEPWKGKSPEHHHAIHILAELLGRIMFERVTLPSYLRLLHLSEQALLVAQTLYNILECLAVQRPIFVESSI
jgi:hypothetical protein